MSDSLDTLANVAADLFISLPESPQGKPFIDRSEANSPAALLRAMRKVRHPARLGGARARLALAHERRTRGAGAPRGAFPYPTPLRTRASPLARDPAAWAARVRAPRQRAHPQIFGAWLARSQRLNLTQREFGTLLAPPGGSAISPSVICTST